jgi:myo-inositol-1(or 4)-monophosphatase
MMALLFIGTAGAATLMPPTTTLLRIEQVAAQLARAGGEYVLAASPQTRTVEFKGSARGTGGNFNPVSNVDREVEQRLRAAIAAEFPEHVVIGEELEAPAREDAPFVWVLDPIDGTSNYLNGLPLFSCSVGVLFEGAPVVGAIWCVSSHERRPGVYHAVEGGNLSFDGAPLSRRPAATWRGLASEPGSAPRHGARFDTRVLGSAALECAYVAAGILRLSHLARPAIWDVAAGIVLARAAGCQVMTRRDGRTEPFQSFSGEKSGTAALRTWRQPLIIADAQVLDGEASAALR